MRNCPRNTGDSTWKYVNLPGPPAWSPSSGVPARGSELHVASSLGFPSSRLYLLVPRYLGPQFSAIRTPLLPVPSKQYFLAPSSPASSSEYLTITSSQSYPQFFFGHRHPTSIGAGTTPRTMERRLAFAWDLAKPLGVFLQNPLLSDRNLGSSAGRVVLLFDPQLQVPSSNPTLASLPRSELLVFTAYPEVSLAVRG